MNTKVHRLTILSLLILVGICSTQGFSQEQNAQATKEPKTDTRTEPTSWGSVYGRVYDSVTGLPIKGGTVLGYTDNGFEEKGKSTGKTDVLGQYQIKLVLGRISHNFDLGRALLSSPLGILFGSATNTTKRIDVARVALMVSADGYKPFEGVVSARSTDAKKFRIDVEPILLAPKSGAGASVSAKGWNAVRIVSASAVPAVAEPKTKVKLSVSIRSFGKEFAKATEMAAFSSLWKGAKKLKLESEAAQGDTSTFVGEYVVSGKEKQKANKVVFAITKSTVDYDVNQSSVSALISIASSESEKVTAAQRVEAVNLVQEGKLREARDIFSKLSKGGSGEAYDWRSEMLLSLGLGEPAAAIEPSKRLWQEDQRSPDAAYRYINSLYEAKEYSEVIQVGEQSLKGVKEKDLPMRVSPASMACLGLAYVQTEDLLAADRINDQLLKIEGSGLEPRVIEFRGKLRLAEVEKAHIENPARAEALADYGRALLDLGRYEEAVAKLAQASAADPGQLSIRKDMAWAALQMKGKEPAPIDLETAVSEQKKLLGLEKGQKKSKDFFTWNQYGLLLFALSDQKEEAGSQDAAEARDQAIEAIREALTLGRVGAKRNSGVFAGFQFGYWSGSEVAISGFAYPQANASFLLLDSLRKLRRDASDKVALLNASTSLLDLGQTRLSQKYCNRLLQAAPDHVEGKFVLALIQYRLDDLPAASQALREVIQSAPNHPRANLVLADILSEMGDAVAAAERSAEHSRYYGDVIRQ